MPEMGSSSPREGLPSVELGGLSRALMRVELVDPTLAALLQRELSEVARQTQNLMVFAERVNVELRRLREDRQLEDQLQADRLRTLHENNDTFVAQLIAEHDAEVLELQRERDAAIARVRELSRGISRVGGMSTSSLRRPTARSSSATPVNAEDAELRARLDELLNERERSLKLLRQLAEQRDKSESRFQALLAEVSGIDKPAVDVGSEASSLGRQPPQVHPTLDAVAPASPADGKESRSHAEVIPTSPPCSDVTAELDDNWDVSDSTPSARPQSEPPTASQDKASSSQVQPPVEAHSLLRRRTFSPLDMGGAYTLSSAEDLPLEEIIVRRGDLARKEHS